MRQAGRSAAGDPWRRYLQPIQADHLVARANAGLLRDFSSIAGYATDVVRQMIVTGTYLKQGFAPRLLHARRIQMLSQHPQNLSHARKIGCDFTRFSVSPVLSGAVGTIVFPSDVLVRWALVGSQVGPRLPSSTRWLHRMGT